MPTIDLRHGDCLDILPAIPSGSIDAVVTDPPYPCIDRPYGRMTEAEWHAMMDRVVPECRRILKPHGSAVFVLQPNSERVGRMRPWLWEFMAKWTREWGMVQDAWWWNPAALPNGGATRGNMLRSSLKACVWLGDPECYRNQAEVLDKTEKPWMKRQWDAAQPDIRVPFPSGNGMNRGRCLASVTARGGTIPFNVLPMGNGSRHNMAGMHGHGAGTPLALCDWWLRYLCPPGGTVCDPFIGSGTVGIAAAKRGCSVVGIERDAGYFATAETRINAAVPEPQLIPA